MEGVINKTTTKLLVVPTCFLVQHISDPFSRLHFLDETLFIQDFRLFPHCRLICVQQSSQTKITQTLLPWRIRRTVTLLALVDKNNTDTFSTLLTVHFQFFVLFKINRHIVIKLLISAYLTSFFFFFFTQLINTESILNLQSSKKKFTFI